MSNWGLRGVRVVEGLTICSVAGIAIATLSFLVANCLLPLGATWLGQERAALEVWAFSVVWLVTFAHAWLRPRRACFEQCATIAALAVGAVALNRTTTGHHFGRSFVQPQLQAIAGMDLVLLAGGAIAALAALGRRRRVASVEEGKSGSSRHDHRRMKNWTGTSSRNVSPGWSGGSGGRGSARARSSSPSRSRARLPALRSTRAFSTRPSRVIVKRT